MSWIAGTLNDVAIIDHWFVMDIGFAEDKKSCGVITVVNNGEPISCEADYAQMILEFKNFIQGKEAIGLIIEAPLSVAFTKTSLDTDGNPVGRRGIEIEKLTKTKTRYWYVGAGAAVTLSALNFLQQIKNNVSSKTKIYIYEGLLSFKNPEKQSHCDDARDLYRAIINLAEQRPDEKSILGENQTSNNTNMKFIGDYVGIHLKNGGMPAVIKVSNTDGDSVHTFHQKQDK
jgi:hypothetical protein